jgi:hypothetical protein
MKLFHQLYPTCAILLAALLLGGCGGTTSGEGTPITHPTPTATSDDYADFGLEVVLRMPDKLPDGKSVEVAFTLINGSETDLYVLNWYTPLEGGLGGDSFHVERNGERVPYRGPLAARAEPTADSYIFLEAGASASATIELAKAYDFRKPGKYAIWFLSPRISHVAKTVDEIPASMDELGPVAMPSNQVWVTVGEDSATGNPELVGYIRSLYEEDGRWHISVDQVEWLTGTEAVEALIEDGLCAGSRADCEPPNGFYIRDRGQEHVSLPLSDQVIILMQTLSHGPDGNHNWDEPIGLDQFYQIMDEDSTSHLRAVPYHLIVDAGAVTVIGERYMP